jgi:hypothetical protein
VLLLKDTTEILRGDDGGDGKSVVNGRGGEGFGAGIHLLSLILTILGNICIW